MSKHHLQKNDPVKSRLGTAGVIREILSNNRARIEWEGGRESIEYLADLTPAN
jgi:hypothetical protein